MPAPELLPTFLLAVTVICATPGPDLAFVLASGIGGGPAAGAIAALGMSAGMVVHTTLAALGLAALLQTTPALLDGVRTLGALYLVHLAVSTLRSARRPRVDTDVGEGASTVAALTVFRRAVLTNLANAKIVLFFAAFLPQFVRPERGDTTVQFLVLGLLFLAVGLVIDVTVGLAAGKLRTVLASGSRVPVVLDAVSALVFATIAAILLIDVISR